MSQLKYLYTNNFDTATLTPSSETSQMPVENVQKDVLGTVWQTKEGFNIVTGFNDKIKVSVNAGTSTVITIPPATYTGAGLATNLQTQMRAAAELTSTIVVNYDDTSAGKFYLYSGNAGVSLELPFSDNSTSTIATDIGFDPYTDKSGATLYSGTTVVAGQEFVQATIPAGTSSYFVIDGYNIPSGGTVLLRLADATSTFSGLRGGSMSSSVTITLVADRTVYKLSSSFSGLGVQMSWQNGSVGYSTIGRIWLGPDFSPANRIDDVISWREEKINRNSNITKAYGGATYFDKRDPVNQFTVPVETLDPYYDATNKTAYETFFDNVGDSKSFYTLFESDLTKNVYGFILGSTMYARLQNTTSINVEAIVIEEQK